MKRLFPATVAVLTVLAASQAFAGRGPPAPTPAPTPTVAPIIPDPWAGRTAAAATQTDPDKAAEEARAAVLFQERFGQELANVRTARDPGAAAVALVAKILNAARVQGIDDAYRILLYMKAMELGLVDPRGYETVVTAATFLAALAPEKADICNDTIINIRQAQFAAAARGDEKLRLGVGLFDALTASAAGKAEAGNLQDAMHRYQQAYTVAKSINHPGAIDAEEQLAVLAERSRVAVHVSQLANQMKTDPDNHLAGDQMLLVQLVDCDNPADAAKYLREDTDASLRKYVPAAAKGIDAAPELACIEMAEWYRRLAADSAATNSAKLAMLRRADGYYRRFLALHTAEDPQRAEINQAAWKVRAEIDHLSVPTVGPPWNDCLRLADPVRDALSGTWQKTESGLTASADTAGKLALRLFPQGAYELEVKFIRDHGEMVGVALPVGNTGVLLSLGGRDNSAGGLDVGSGRPTPPNPGRPGRPGQPKPDRSDPPNTATADSGAIVDGQPYTVLVRVQVILEQATVNVTLDGKPFSKWTGSAKALSSGEFSAALPPRVWLVTDRSQVTFTSVRLRVLNGPAAPVASLGGPAAPAGAAVP